MILQLYRPPQKDDKARKASPGIAAKMVLFSNPQRCGAVGKLEIIGGNIKFTSWKQCN
jgi:hypothetical protein